VKRARRADISYDVSKAAMRTPRKCA
jgi:hypothetical protein